MSNVILFSLFNCALIICLYKWKVVPDWFDYYKPKFMIKYRIDWCEFCFFFWCGMVEWLLFSIFDKIDSLFFVSAFFHAMCIAFASIYLYESYKSQKRNRD